jgi:hypothetical protein
MADQAKGNGVEDAPEKEPTAACHRVEFFLEIVSAPHWQGIEPRPLDLERLAPASVGASDHLIDEAAIRIEVSKIAAATQQQRLLQGHLEMCVRPLDRAVLMRHPGIVARRRHAVVRAQCLVTACQILHGVPFQIAKRGRETVAAMLRGCATQGPERVLQPLGQGNETLAAQHHPRVLPTGERQAEMVQPVLEPQRQQSTRRVPQRR